MKYYNYSKKSRRDESYSPAQEDLIEVYHTPANNINHVDENGQNDLTGGDSSQMNVIDDQLFEHNNFDNPVEMKQCHQERDILDSCDFQQEL